MATLKVLSGANSGTIFDLNDQETLVGRDRFCDVRLPVRTISRQHARIIKLPSGNFVIEDLASVNGTLINDERVQGRAELSNKDQIRIHDVILLFDSEHPLENEEEEDADGDRYASSTAQTTFVGNAMSGRPDRILSQVDARKHDLADENIENPWIKLRAVIELTKNLGSTLSQHEILPRILDCLFKIFPQTERGYILQAGDNRQLEPVAIKHRDSESDVTISPFGGRIVRRVMSDGTAFLSSNAHEEDDRQTGFDSVLDDDEIRSVMCAPLLGLAEEALGVIHIETGDSRRPYLDHDLELLVSIGNLAGRAAEAAKMHETLLMLDRQKQALEMARDVQLHFLPQQPPTVPNYSFFDFYQAAYDIAGDYFDYIEMPDGRWGIAVGDVAGKGASAALLMARLCSEVRYCLLAKPTAKDAVELLNSQLRDQLIADKFVTLVLLLIDPENHHLTVVNAGHTPPFRRRGNQIEL
ncbi:MAG: SpoIIE family protein phosphatase, partial [Planctomycetales bacterium]